MALPFLLRTFCYFAVLAGLLFWERQAPFAPSEQAKTSRVLFHVGLSIANSIVLYLLLAWPLLAAVSLAKTHRTGLCRLIGLDGWQEICATVIFFDLWDYWMHLANHRLPFLWRFHRAHHSDMEIDVTTASRFHAGELLISGGVKCLFILLWGPSWEGVLAFDICLTAASQFHHGNLGIPLRVQDHLEKVIVTPRMHRCHHSLRRKCSISNFATILSLWDRLFRTHHHPLAVAELAPIGLSEPRGPVTMQLKPFLLTPFREG